MTKTLIKDSIEKIYSEVNDIYKEEKSHEEKVNEVLDGILDLKKDLITDSSKINNLCTGFEKLTWHESFDEEILQSIKKLILSSKDLHSKLVKRYIKLAFFRKKGIAKEEIKLYKRSVDLLREANDEMENIFFVYPNDPEFVEITKKINEIE
jgi:hypothetical protein